MAVENSTPPCVINNFFWKVVIHQLIHPLISNLEVSFMKGTTLELACNNFKVAGSNLLEKLDDALYFDIYVLII